MSTYKTMYCKLFNKITDVITELQEVQKLAEEIFIAKKDSMENTLDLCENTEKRTGTNE